jgi:hypothetical protein
MQRIAILIFAVLALAGCSGVEVWSYSPTPPEEQLITHDGAAGGARNYP